MECYNTRCNEDCNNFKKIYCLRKVSEEQYRIISKLKGVNTCNICGCETVAAKYIIAKNRYRRINLCTNCKNKERIA